MTFLGFKGVFGFGFGFFQLKPCQGLSSEMRKTKRGVGFHVSEMWLHSEQMPVPCTAFPFLWWSYHLKFLTITSTFSHPGQETHLEKKLYTQTSIAVEKGWMRLWAIGWDNIGVENLVVIQRKLLGVFLVYLLHCVIFCYIFTLTDLMGPKPETQWDEAASMDYFCSVQEGGILVLVGFSTQKEIRKK